jgi:hypothetical protein
MMLMATDKKVADVLLIELPKKTQTRGCPESLHIFATIREMRFAAR